MSLYGQTFKRNIHTARRKEQSKNYKKKKKGPEAIIQDAIMKALNDRGFVVIRINSSMLWSEETGIPVKSYLIFGIGKSSGMSDLLILKNNRAWIIEVKVPRSYLNANQREVQVYFESRGVIYNIARSVDDALRIVGVE